MEEQMKSTSIDSSEGLVYTDTVSSIKKTFNLPNSLISKLRFDLKKPILREVKPSDFGDLSEDVYDEEEEEKMDFIRRVKRGSPAYVGEAMNEDAKEFFMFEVNEMFSPEIKEFFEANFKRRMNVAEKTKTVSRFLDSMLEWEDVPKPLSTDFWVNISSSMSKDLINEESIAKVESEITSKLSRYKLTMRQYLDQFYPKQNEL